MIEQPDHAGPEDHDGTRLQLRRRGVIAGAAALTAALLAKQVHDPQPVGATSGTGLDGALIMGSNNANNPNTAAHQTLLQRSGPGAGIGSMFAVDCTSTGGNFTDNVDALFGHGSGAGTGVTGFGGPTSGIGVFGLGTVSGSTGVSGQCDGSTGNGVFGTGGLYGVRGDAGPTPGATGVYGFNSAAGGTGLLGSTTGGNASIGVKGSATNGTGVYGTTTTGLYGVRGDAGSAAGSAGVLGYTNQAGGVAFGTIAVAPATVAGYFNGTTIVNGNFGVSGTKSAIVKDATGNHRLMYCVEAPESWFEDFGEGALSGGNATITLDPDFATLIHTDTYFVFPVSHDVSCKGLSITARAATGFTVQEQNGGTSSGSFAWRLVAKRADVKGERLAKFTMPTLTVLNPVTTPQVPDVKPPAPPSPIPPQARSSDATATTQAPASVSTTVPPSSLPAPAPPRRP